MPTSAAGPAPYPGLRRLLAEDVAAARGHFHDTVGHAFPSLFVVAAHRLAHALHRRGRRIPAHAVAALSHVLTGAEIRPAARIGGGFVVVHPTAVIIGSDVVAGRRLSLYGVNTLGSSTEPTLHGDVPDPGAQLVLGDDVVVCSHASILGALTVGSRVVVSAYSAVLSDVPDGVRVRGVPAAWDAPTPEAPAPGFPSATAAPCR